MNRGGSCRYLEHLAIACPERRKNKKSLQPEDSPDVKDLLEQPQQEKKLKLKDQKKKEVGAWNKKWHCKMFSFISFFSIKNAKHLPLIKGLICVFNSSVVITLWSAYVF